MQHCNCRMSRKRIAEQEISKVLPNRLNDGMVSLRIHARPRRLYRSLLNTGWKARRTRKARLRCGAIGWFPIDGT